MTGLEEKQKQACPVCTETTLVKHCQSPTCDWHICRNRVCDATVDLVRRRGHYRGLGGTGLEIRKRWVP